jgi:hypothetical protein
MQGSTTRKASRERQRRHVSLLNRIPSLMSANELSSSKIGGRRFIQAGVIFATRGQ